MCDAVTNKLLLESLFPVLQGTSWSRRAGSCGDWLAHRGAPRPPPFSVGGHSCVPRYVGGSGLVAVMLVPPVMFAPLSVLRLPLSPSPSRTGSQASGAQSLGTGWQRPPGVPCRPPDTPQGRQALALSSLCCDSVYPHGSHGDGGRSSG